MHRKRKIASATSETSGTMQMTFVNELANQQLNTGGFDESYASDECMHQLKQVEFNTMHQLLVLLMLFQVKQANVKQWTE